jgi:hypothetical protein
MEDNRNKQVVLEESEDNIVKCSNDERNFDHLTRCTMENVKRLIERSKEDISRMVRSTVFLSLNYRPYVFSKNLNIDGLIELYNNCNFNLAFFKDKLYIFKPDKFVNTRDIESADEVLNFNIDKGFIYFTKEDKNIISFKLRNYKRV